MPCLATSQTRCGAPSPQTRKPQYELCQLENELSTARRAALPQPHALPLARHIAPPPRPNRTIPQSELRQLENEFSTLKLQNRDLREQNKRALEEVSQLRWGAGAALGLSARIRSEQAAGNNEGESAHKDAAQGHPAALTPKSCPPPHTHTRAHALSLSLTHTQKHTLSLSVSSL